MQVFPSSNSNGSKLNDFASVNELKITNTFFRHKEIHKMIWSAQVYRSIIDYILTNKKLSPLVQDTKVFDSNLTMRVQLLC